MQGSRFNLLAALTLGAALPAFADLTASAPDGFRVEVTRALPVPPTEVIETAKDIGAWWHPDHTYSGDASNLKLQGSYAGALWLETWSGGSVEHGRLIFVDGTSLSFDASLGPLQPMAVEAVLTIAAETDPEAGETVLTFDYRVNGSSVSDLTGIAPAVDFVITEAADRLVAKAREIRESGLPEEP